MLFKLLSYEGTHFSKLVTRLKQCTYAQKSILDQTFRLSNTHTRHLFIELNLEHLSLLESENFKHTLLESCQRLNIDPDLVTHICCLGVGKCSELNAYFEVFRNLNQILLNDYTPYMMLKFNISELPADKREKVVQSTTPMETLDIQPYSLIILRHPNKADSIQAYSQILKKAPQNTAIIVTHHAVEFQKSWATLLRQHLWTVQTYRNPYPTLLTEIPFTQLMNYERSAEWSQEEGPTRDTFTTVAIFHNTQQNDTTCTML